MKLYYLPGACSFVPHTALEWIGEPYEAEGVNHAKIKSPEYLALNPQGAVPLLVDGDFVLSQNIAILSYLDDIYPEAELFGSKTAQDKAKAMRWLSFFNSDIHPTFKPLFRVPEYAKGNDELTAAVKQAAANRILELLEVAHTHLQKHIFFGEKISVADIYLYVMLGWCQGLGLDFSHLPQLKAFIERVEADKAVDSVRIQEGLKG
ncbi:glutathione S-transferase family protein [Glaesserella sp.]|uniref:glutathione S-transferase family protein n=1 Tax=Glaesserella sp. TaxID=2094731 RepID=UPI00359F2A8E